MGSDFVAVLRRRICCLVSGVDDMATRPHLTTPVSTVRPDFFRFRNNV